MNWRMTKSLDTRGGGDSHRTPREAPACRSVTIGNLVFLSGIGGLELKSGEVVSQDLAKQVITTLDNIKTSLEEAGSSLENLIKYSIFLKKAGDASQTWKTMLEYFQQQAPGLVSEPPAVSVSEVIAFERSGSLVEIDAIAVLSPQKQGWEIKKNPMLYRGIKQVFPNIEPGTPFFSESVTVGNLVFLSAMDAVHPASGKIETENFEEQMDVAFDKIKQALANAGTTPDNIIKTLHYLTGIGDLMVKSQDLRQSFSPASDRLWKRELEHYDVDAALLFDLPPASTFLKVPALANPRALVQLDAIAAVDRNSSGWEVKNYLLYLGRRGFPRHIGEIKKYYSNSVVVGNLAFISGQTPTNVFTAKIESDIFEEQAKAALHNLKMALEEIGSSLENLAKTLVLVPKPEHLALFRKIETEFYRTYAPSLIENPPASTVIHPLNLAGTNLQIEIEAIAYVPDSG